MQSSPTAEAADLDWSWAHATASQAEPTISAAEVAGVMVVHNGEPWLARTLVSLARLEQRPGMIIAIDADSSDGSRDLLDRAVDEGVLDEVVDAPAQGYGAALATVVPMLPGDYVWLWLLHDDAEPRRDCLQQLLLAASSDHPDLLVPALLEPRRRNHAPIVREVGQSITAGGARHLSVEPGEIDQRQIEAAPTLGGSTCGMLLTRAAYDSLGGCDPDLPLFRDGLDLGWRAHEAGLRVVTAPRAGLHHRQAGRLGDRDTGLGEAESLDRRLGLRVVAAHRNGGALTRLRLCCSALMRALALLLGKAPTEALAWVRAATGLLGDGSVIARMRERNPDAGLRPAALTAVLPSRREVARTALSRVAAGFTGRYRDVRDEHRETSLDELTGDDFAGGRSRSRLAAPGTWALLIVGFGCLIVARHHLGSGSLVGPRLLPAPGSWGQAVQAWLREPVGLPGANAPWLGWAEMFSLLMGGSAEVAARVLVFGAPLFAALTSGGLLRWLIGRRSAWLRAGLALLYGLSVVLLGATGRGSLATALLAVVLPLIALAGLRWFAFDEVGRAEQWRAPAALALWLGLMAMATPLFVAVGVLIALSHGLVHRRWSLRTLTVALAPALVIGPWWPRLFNEPGRLLSTADPLSQMHPQAPSGGWQFVGGPAGGWTAVVCALVIAGLVVLASVAAIAATRRGRTGPLIWLAISLAAWALALGLGKQAFLIDGAVARPAVDAWLLSAVMAVVVSLAMSHADAEEVGRRHTQATVGAVLGLALLAVVAWIPGNRVQTLAVSSQSLPEYVTAVEQAKGSRTLMVDLSSGTASSPSAVRWSLVSAERPRWGSAEQNPAGDQAAALALGSLVKRISEGAPGDDLHDQLRLRGIGHLWVRGAKPHQIGALNNAQGLSPGMLDEQTRIWVVRPGISSQPSAARWGWWSAVVEVAVLASLALVAIPGLGPSPSARGRRREEVSR